MFKSSTSEDFEQFLKTLDKDIDQAGEKYVALRQRLEKFFEWRDCENTEELIDIVFDRVTKKITEGEKVQNAEAFCVSVAKFVLLENRRKAFRSRELDENSKEVSAASDSAEPGEEDERGDTRLRCLEECLAKLPDDKRRLIISYFSTEEKTMISARRKLAQEIGTNLNSLRIRVSRLKSKLERCTKECCEKD
ncbi:MAG: hypothetical protein HKN33_05775 [Pyrinomonadaceae bacterium]|nr:hypothetical protein [Pyrinomonadaceae bacterium]